MKRLAVGAMVLLGALASLRAGEPEMRLSPKEIRDEARAVVEAQLAALRKGDFAAAYEFAAAGIKRQFDARVFGLMIKRGYAPLLRQVQTDLGLVRDDGASTAQVAVTVIDGLNRSTPYRYWLVKEEAGWRISGVMLVQKPPRGDI